MEEIWKDVKGYECYYEVSNLGRVKRKKGETIYKDGRIAHFSETVLKPTIFKKGYLMVYLSKNANKRTIQVHRIVADAFIANPENKESTFYEIKRIVNDSVLQSLTISKASNENGQSMISEFKIIDNVFVFPKTYKSDNGTNYGIDRVFITENGKLFEATENV